MKNKYLTERERYKIEVWKESGVTVKCIAERLDKCEATIYRELRRGRVTLRRSDYTEYTCYKADVGQRVYEENSKNKGRELKIANDYDFVNFVETMIRDKRYSPVAVLYHIRNNHKNFKTKVCFKTLYNYIENGVFLGVTNKDLPIKKNASKKPQKRVRVAFNNLKGTSIEERPECVRERDEYGHWELDTVVSGRGSKTSLFVFTERMTRQEYIFKEHGKTAVCCKRVLDRLERVHGAVNFRNKFKTITCDNGVEFLDFQSIEQSCINKHVPRTNVYYCHPYSSYERGSNENQNKLIRRFIPKGADISVYSKQYILDIQEWMNSYPRAIFDGYSSNDMLDKLAK